jgi:hypothetical protein
MGAPKEPPRQFFHYVNEKGQDVVVDDIREVPEALRGQAAIVTVPRKDNSHLPLEPGATRAAILDAGRALGARDTPDPGTVGNLTVESSNVPHAPGWIAPAPGWGAAWALDVPSFGLGVLMALVLAAVLSMMRGSGMKVVLQLVVVAVLMGTVSTVYVTWLQNVFRAQAGLPPSASPMQTVDDARAAREEANRAVRAAEKALNEVP